jgi:hypothetical protein
LLPAAIGSFPAGQSGNISLSFLLRPGPAIPFERRLVRCVLESLVVLSESPLAIDALWEQRAWRAQRLTSNCNVRNDLAVALEFRDL